MRLLRCALLPGPARCCVQSPLQATLYAGLHTGAIAAVPLAGPIARVRTAAAGGSGSDALGAQQGHSSSSAADVVGAEECALWQHHTSAENRIALAPDVLHLVSDERRCLATCIKRGCVADCRSASSPDRHRSGWHALH